nr:hypothetical protein [Tanacetum cinerariifolium]
MLNKDNYVPWSFRLLRYAKSKPNKKLIYNSVMHGSYVRRIISEPGDPDREILVAETFHKQIDGELIDKEVKQMEDDDQAIKIILMGLLEDIYAAVDSCETAQKIWLHFQYMMKGYDIGIQDKKAKQIAQPSINLGQDRQMQMIRVQNPGIQNVRNQNGLIVVSGIANHNVNQNGNGNVVVARAAGNGNNEDRQASTSGTQTDKAPVYDSDGSAEFQVWNKVGKQ